MEFHTNFACEFGVSSVRSGMLNSVTVRILPALTSSALPLPFYRSLRFRLSLVIAAVIFAAVMVTAMFAAANSFDRELTLKRDLLSGAASAYAAALADPVISGERGEILATLRGVRELPGFVQADVTNSDGQVLAQFGSGAILVGRNDNAQDMETSDLWAARQLRIEMPIVNGGVEVGKIGLLGDISDVRAAIFAEIRVTAITALIAILISIGIAQWVISRITKPLRQLSELMSSFADDRAAVMPTVEAGQDETGVLATAFNAMIASISDRDRRIDRHLETLEDTVAERTHDLSLARDEAEAANAAKSDFLATMSHEIRTPMNGMLVMAEMLSSADLSQRHRRYAQIIARSGNSLLAIINDILDLSKIESGKLDLELRPVSLDELVSDVSTLFWERAREKQVDIATYVASDVPAGIVTDPTRLNQIITNLVNNALKFTETGGVEIRVGALATEADEHAQIVIEVEDTGIGIPEDKIEHIFEAFSQADQSTTRNFGGTGLGLAVCRRLADALGGDISVESVLGQGSVFRLVFPAEVTEPAPVWPVSGMSVGVDLGTGLMAQALRRSLSDFNCMIGTETPDLVISNSQRLQGAAPASGPNVLLSDIGDTQASRLLRDGQAADLLPNPFTRADLADLLTRAEAGTLRGVGALYSQHEVTERPDFAGLHVLAADDNAVNREVLGEALATLGVSVDFAEDGVGAVEMAAGGSYDAIFMDGSMPVMDGFEATRRIRAAEQGADCDTQTPIIALTAQVAGTDADVWMDAGADAYMAKPFTLERLTAALSDLGTPRERTKEPEPVAEGEPAVSSDIFDAETLAGFTKMSARSGRDLKGKVWALFRTKAPDGLADIREALAQSVPAREVSRKAHALKSMALSAGAAEFATACGRLEHAAASEDDANTLAQAAQEIAASLDRTLSAMDAAGDEQSPVRKAASEEAAGTILGK